MSPTGIHRVLRRIEVAALGALLGALFMTGAAAAIAFPTVRDLDPSLALYSEYPEDHWLITAGAVMARVFTVYDIVQLACAAIAGATFVASMRSAGLGLLTLARGALIAALLLSIMQYTFVIRADMDSQLLLFLNAAEQGDVAVATAARDAFDALHPVASTRLSIHAVGALAALLLAVVTGVKSAPAGPLSTNGGPE